MNEESLSFIPLLLVVGLALVVPFALARFKRIPVVVGEIMAGILIGQSGLGFVHEDQVLVILSEIGFAFLMFLSGLEIDFSVLLNPALVGGKKQLHPLWIAIISFAITFILAVLVGFVVVRNDLARDPWMMALILSTTSLGVVVPVLKEREMTNSQLGQVILLASLLADFLTMFLITVYVALLSTGLTLEILLISILFVAFLIIYRLGIWQFRRPSVRRIIDELSGATSQIKVRGSVALMMAFVVLAEFLGVELILGAFLAGAVISLISPPGDEELRHKLDAIGFGFFIPLFFIVVGVEFDLGALLSEPSALLLTPFLLIVAFLLKSISALIFKAVFSWRETLAAGGLLSARLSLIIAASAIGLRMGIISEATNSDIILIAALTSILAPLSFNWLLPAKEKEHQRFFLVYGATNIGVQVGKELEAHGEHVRFLDPDRRLIDLVRREGFQAEHGHADADGLEKVDYADVDAVIAVSGNDDQNMAISKEAKSLGISHVVSVVNEPSRVPEFREIGSQTFTPAMYRAILLALMARNPDIFTLLTSTSDGRDIREVRVWNPVMVGKRLDEVVLPGDSLILVIGKDQQDDVVIPHGTTRLEYGDRLTVLGDVEALERVCWLMEGENC